jgi:arginase family enzyme
MDGLDPAYAPGVAHREPGGPPRQVIDLIHTIEQQRVVAADIVEFNPAATSPTRPPWWQPSCSRRSRA